MALTPLAGGATTTAKVGDVNALVAALNTELDILRERLTAYESQIGGRITLLEGHAHSDYPPDLTDRVEALENLVQRVPVENPNPAALGSEPMAKPPDLDPGEVTLIYDRATLYYQGMELYAVRVGPSTWRLLAQLNFVTISPVLWTYDEVIEGTPDEVYAHAHQRLLELAELKPQHDHVHERVRAMSEGRE